RRSDLAGAVAVEPHLGLLTRGHFDDLAHPQPGPRRLGVLSRHGTATAAAVIFDPSTCPSDGTASQLHRSRLITSRPGASGEMLAKLCALPSLNQKYRYSTLSPSGSTAGSTTLHVSGWPGTGGAGVTASRPPLGGMLPMVRCALAGCES